MRARPPLTDGVGRVLAAEGIFNFGSMLSRLAIPWIATLTLAASPLAVAGSVSEAAARARRWGGQWIGAVIALGADALSVALSCGCLRWAAAWRPRAA